MDKPKVIEITNTGTMQRDARFVADEGAVNEETRTAQISFASDFPVFRDMPWGSGYEVLDLANSDFSRLQDGAALLVDHSLTDQVGVVENARVEEGRLGRASVRFGRGTRASEIFQDVIDKVRSKISVGYNILSAIEDGEKDGYPIYRVAISPYELSLVSVPADPTVGVGRAKDETIIPPKQEAKAMTDTNEAPKFDIAEVRSNERAAAQKDIATNAKRIMEVGAQHGFKDEALDAIQTGMPVAQFESSLNAKYAERMEAQKLSASAIGVSSREMKRYSLKRVADYLISGDASKAGFELEVSRGLSDKLGTPKGVYVPHDIFNRATPMSTGVAADGGDLVGTEHLGSETILALHNRTVLAELGAQAMTGLVGNIQIPKVNTLPTTEWITEGNSPTDSQMTLELVTMSPKTIAAAVPYTRSLMLQSDPSIEMLLQEEIMRSLSVGIDTAGLKGAVNGPVGIMGTTGVLTQTVGTPGQPTYAEIVGFETQVASANALMGNPAYVTTSGVIGSLKTTPRDAGSGIMIINEFNPSSINNHSYVPTQEMDANGILFGDFTQLMIGYWGAMDLVIDKATLASSGGTVLRVFQDLDYAVRYPQAFCKNA